MKRYWAWAPTRHRRSRVQKKIDARNGALRLLPRYVRKISSMTDMPPSSLAFHIVTKKKHVIAPPSRGAGVLAFEYSNRVVARTKVDQSEVSTIFIGFNHGSEDHPLFFETAIYRHNEYRVVSRHGTWDESLAYHKETVETLSN